MAVSIRPRLLRRQVSLFLIAILVPCLVLVALGLRMMEQERQLEDKRSADERQLLVVGVRQDLLAFLERIRLQHVTRVAAGGREDSRQQKQEAVAFVGARSPYRPMARKWPTSCQGGWK